MADLRSDPAAATAESSSAGTQAERTAARLPVGWLVVVVPVLVELVVGGYRISGPSFWRDEGYTIVGAQRPLGAIFALVQHQDAFHGLYLLMMHPIIATFGTSEFALRVPSLLAMSAAAGLTAALGRRLAQVSGLAGAPAIGMIAGLLLAALPVTTRYAQEGRPYALTILFAAATTYLLVVAAAKTGGRWWVLYSAALVVTALFDLVAVLLALAHGVSLVSARRVEPGDDAHDPHAAGISASVLRRWFVACAAAAVALSPLVVFSFRQRTQLDWVQSPNVNTVYGLLQDFAAVTLLMPVVGALVVLGCLAAPGLRRGRGLTLALVCLPWFLLPPSLLLSISLVHPVYVDRYILFSLPALAILVATGLVWLVSLMRRWIPGRMPERRALVLSALPSAALALLIAVMVIGPQAAIRLPNSRADDLRTISRIVATYERPGDAVLYLPRLTAVIGRAYSAPFNKLNDIDMLSGPIPSGTLLGVPAGPKVVARRLKGVERVWTVEWVHPLSPDSAPPADLVKLLAHMKIVGSWLVQSVLLVLYAEPTR